MRTAITTVHAGEENYSKWRKDQNGGVIYDVENYSHELSLLEEEFDTCNLFDMETSLDIPIISPLAATRFDLLADLGFNGIIQDEGESFEGIQRAPTSFPSSTSGAVSTVGISGSSSIPAFSTSPFLSFQIPSFIEFSEQSNRRALLDHFCNVLSHLIVFREENGNPFQQLILPLSHQSRPVINALYALASAHLEYRGVIGPESSVQFHNMALQGLSKLIELDKKSKRNEILAAIMLLVYYEVVSN